MAMMIACPTCRRSIPYDTKNPYRPFCCERCKLIDLGHWASGDYKIVDEPGSADPQFVEEELERMAREQAQTPGQSR